MFYLFNLPVLYLHLTVKDFLAKVNVWSRLLDRTRCSAFDAIVSSLWSSMLFLKTPVRETDPLDKIRGHRLVPYVNVTIAYALQAENTTKKPHMPLLDNLDRTCEELHTKHRGNPDCSLFQVFHPCDWRSSL